MKYYITQQGLEFVNEISAAKGGEVAGRVLASAAKASEDATKAAEYKQEKDTGLERPRGRAGMPTVITPREAAKRGHHKKKWEQADRIKRNFQLRAKHQPPQTDAKDKDQTETQVTNKFAVAKNSAIRQPSPARPLPKFTSSSKKEK